MRGFFSLLLLSACAFFAAYSYFSPPTDREAKLSEITRILAMRAQEAPEGARSYASEGFRSYAPSVAAPAPQQPANREPRETSRPQLVSGPARVWRATAAEKQPEERSWSAVVTTEPSASSSPLSRLKSLKPSNDSARYELVRDLQKELKRVGCYGGEISGSWGAGSKRAMAAFTERVNATLPVEEPDYVLLALVQAQQSVTCSDKCPAGQGRAESGRCVPQAILARDAKKAAPAADVKVAAAPRATTSGWTAATKTEPHPVPVPRLATAPAKPPAIAAAPPAPLPGRMTIGGPRPPAETVNVAQAPKASITSDGVAPPARVAALDSQTAASPPSASQEAIEESPAPPAAVTETRPAAASLHRAPTAERRKPSRNVDSRSSYSRGYVPPPPHMLGAFYQDKPAYTAARRGW